MLWLIVVVFGGPSAVGVRSAGVSGSGSAVVVGSVVCVAWL